MSASVFAHLIIKKAGIEVIKLEFILKIKIKHNDWLLAAKHYVYFELKTVLKFELIVTSFYMITG